MAKPNDVKKTTATETPAPAPEKKVAKPGELKALFKAYSDADKEYRTLERSLDALAQKRSDVVKAIGEFGKGPYEFEGKLLTVTSRKNEEKETVRFFFKSTGEQEVTKVA